MKLTNKNNFSKRLLLSLAPIVLLAAAVFGYILLKHDTAKNSNEIKNVNYNPATEQDKARADETKQQNLEREKLDNTTPSTSSSTVNPVITYAGQYGDVIEVGAYVDGIFEDGGQCTATMSLGDQKIEKTVSAEKNVRSMDCPVMQFPRAEMKAAGSWTVRVSYKSVTSTGVSAARQVEVK